jgi:hypothetical protein
MSYKTTVDYWYRVDSKAYEWGGWSAQYPTKDEAWAEMLRMADYYLELGHPLKVVAVESICDTCQNTNSVKVCTIKHRNRRHASKCFRPCVNH